MIARSDSLGIEAEIQESDSDSLQSEEDSDVEAQLEAFMNQAIVTQGKDVMNLRAS